MALPLIIPLLYFGRKIIKYLDEKDTISTVPSQPIIENFICLVGSASSGKSSTGNALLGYKYFDVSAANGSTITVSAADYKQGFKIKDTPGLMDSVKYDDVAIAEIKKAKIIVYVSSKAPYGPELEFIKRIHMSVISSHQHFLFYLNNQDERDRMTRKDAATVYSNTIDRLDPWVSEANVVVGASDPVKNGEKIPAEIGMLANKIEYLINS